MITLHCKLTFESENDKEKLMELMRRFSSCYRYAYNRLLEGQNRNNLKKELQKIFNLNSRYCDDAIMKAQSLIDSCKETGRNPKNIIFGGKRLFEKLSKKHLNGKGREKVKQKWEERRKSCLYSRGDKSKKGNLNTRIEFEKDKLILRINIGNKVWIKTDIKRTVTRQSDKWINFIAYLLQAKTTGEYFPYSVEIIKINNNFYAFISYEEMKSEEPVITKDNGIIGIDINANPFHIAMVSVKPDGNLEKIRRMSLHNPLGKAKNQREYLSWQIAHQITDIAKEENKAIAIEILQDIPKGERRDGNGKLRKRLQQWIYKGLLEKIKTLAKRKRIQVIEVNPAYTSVIGVLKYAPQYNLDKDIAGAFVIGRKALGFKERLPRNYKKLISDKEYLMFAEKRIEQEKQKVKEKLEKETNEYKRKPIKKKLRELDKSLKLIQSLCSEPQAQKPVNQWKEQVRGLYWASYKLWQVTKATLAFPVLGKSLSRDLSPLKSIIVSGDWDRVASRLALGSWAEGYDMGKYRLSGTCPYLKEAEYKYPDLECSFIHFS